MRNAMYLIKVIDLKHICSDWQAELKVVYIDALWGHLFTLHVTAATYVYIHIFCKLVHVHCISILTVYCTLLCATDLDQPQVCKVFIACFI